MAGRGRSGNRGGVSLRQLLAEFKPGTNASGIQSTAQPWRSWNFKKSAQNAKPFADEGSNGSVYPADLENASIFNSAF